MKSDLIFPMAAYFFLMVFSTVYMFRERKKAVISGVISKKYFRAQIGEPPPENLVVIGRHYDNQFQVPVLFFITCLTLMQLGVESVLSLSLAWIFVFSRMIHSFILLGKNHILNRVTAFGLGWLALILLWLQILYLNLI